MQAKKPINQDRYRIRLKDQTKPDEETRLIRMIEQKSRRGHLHDIR